MSITRLTTNGLTGTKYDTVSADNYYMEPIATTLLTSTASGVTFSNIPQNYKHLQIRIFAQSSYSVGSDALNLNFNNDTTSTYRHHQIFGNGTSVTANQTTDTNGMYISRFGNTTRGNYGAAIVDILDYSSGYKFKTTRNLGGVDWNGTLEGAIYYSSGLYPSTAPITTLRLQTFGGSVISANSRFSLYGIKG